MLDVYQQEMNDWAIALGARSGTAREHAREHLVEMGSAATGLLESLLQEAPQQVRWESALALKEIADPASVPALIDALEDADKDVRWIAAEALAVIGEPSVRPLLEAVLLRGDSLEIREGAHHVFSQIEDEALKRVVGPVFHAIGKSLPPEIVIVAAGEALSARG
jgi:HEAT repeat protein